MNIRKMLFIVIPSLFIVSNAVAFFIFQSGITVQKSYNVMLDRVLLYKQITGQTQDNLRALNVYLTDRSEISRNEFIHQRTELDLLRKSLSTQDTLPSTDLTVRSYRHMIDTFTEQEGNVMQALSRADSLAYAAFYEEAEQTAVFIQDEGHHLIDLELSYYQPFYRQILTHTKVMNYWGVAVFILNTLISVLFAYWISLGITRPIKQLTKTAQQISDGNLQAPSPQMSQHHEFGILSKAFERMQDNLQELIEKEKESLEKDRLVKALELEVLQNQMNPHFLFNSLNVLSKLALLEGAEKTSDLTVTMSNLLRYNLRKLDRPVTLKDEVEHAKEYFTIQQARFRDRIQFITDIDERGLGVLVPTLTLQPLLENGFVHGMEGMEEGAEIKLMITCGPGEVQVSISDNGIGMSEEVRQSLLHFESEPTVAQHKGQSTGLGTRNVFRRLELFYGKKDLIDIYSEPGRGTTVLIRLPVAEKEGEDVPLIDRR
ncbi:two-component sensor histidine kinase [Paenibacillus selenitireducens]|uniref:histidine kinase n=1 Tax=Paenibacillus selenitireducens TaxID=1324314 RepID=A0A1T2XGY9_9BACL|nr:sensor histidine kinase [Paenibacillus selenitireducens]OPA79151.1 two-component sensor histidine kinase [Paenibacillus selenitireducens]